ncbi:fimbrial protein [Candidatus Pantoea floridensis]|uniref:Pilin (Type 1 fimbria component protein) n=1 Tax=Candidatus Pantoea floridensis TaxID=1938870 RepID=A0A286BTQ4_9GAMM|nr:fimbrial protein [Pantoea floridensis]PIF24073.1 type 1 fimbria pilin [Enterobacteriaceae bacterium JKS000233]SOD37526.1 Pilin (type 1 fimbria component protein) [Pantoea floridensis]
MKTATAIIFCLMLLTAARFAVADTDVNFSGTLVETPCVLDPKDKEIEIDVGSVIVKYLYSYQRSPATPFAVHLLNCDLSLGKAVRFRFSGTEDSSQPGFFALAPNDNSAQGVALGLETSEHVFIPIESTGEFIDLRPDENSFNFHVFISASKAAIAQQTIRPGAIVVNILFRIEYQ